MKDSNSDATMAQAVKMMSANISSIKKEVKKLEAQRENQVEKNNGDGVPDDLESELIAMKAEIDVLLKTIPEGYPEDEQVSFFLTIAELKRANDVLRQQNSLTVKNLQSAKQSIEATKAWIEDLEEINEKLRNAKTETLRANRQTVVVPPEQKVKDEISNLDNKIRATKKLYKEFKSYLSDYLQLTNDKPEDGDSPQSKLLQALWTKFQESKEDSDSYVTISHLDFDVSPEDLLHFIKANLVEEDPDNKDRIRLVNMTK